MSEIAIKVENVSKDFILPHEKVTSVKSAFTSLARRHSGRTKETQHALKNISFEIKKGEFFGIVGRNGSGKSTMLKILAGIYQPTHGKVYTSGKLVPFIELGVGFNPELTGRENVYLNGAMLGFSEKEISAMYDDIVAFAELENFMDQKLKNYSSGMQVRLAFSMATRSEADILLIDEVLAVGDADFQRKCFEYFKMLKKNNQTVVFVSHDMNAVKEFCDQALLIDKSELVKIGLTKGVADEYSKLFLKETPESDEPDEPEIITEREGKRWGNQQLRFSKINVDVKTDEVIFTAEAKANSRVEDVLYGLHVSSQDGVELTAMNNRMIDVPDLKIVEADEVVTFTWKMLNIFNDGKYYVSLTLVNDAGVPFDWFNDAATFIVRRAERSTTAILPPVSVKYRIN